MSSSDSWGLTIAGVCSIAVRTGWAGSLMSSTAVPVPVMPLVSTSRGNSSVES